MTAITFDTHEFITELKQAGLTEPQAEVITRLHRQAINTTIDYVKHEHDLVVWLPTNIWTVALKKPS